VALREHTGSIVGNTLMLSLPLGWFSRGFIAVRTAPLLCGRHHSSCDPAEPSGLIVFDGLDDFLLSIHHERSLLHDWLT
jgi:hypothetical protein